MLCRCLDVYQRPEMSFVAASVNSCTAEILFNSKHTALVSVCGQSPRFPPGQSAVSFPQQERGGLHRAKIHQSELNIYVTKKVLEAKSLLVILSSTISQTVCYLTLVGEHIQG